MHRLSGTIGVLFLTLTGAAARADNWATQVVKYDPGLTYPSPDPKNTGFVPPTGGVNQAYATASTAQLAGITGDTSYGALTPFNAAFDPSQYVGIGQGGSITLQFATPVSTAGYTIGIHTASGLIDFDWPNGSAGTTAANYTTLRSAAIDVSSDGSHWIPLGTFELDNPTNYYASGVTTPGYQDVGSLTGATLANVDQPFVGSVSSFDGEDWSQILATLNGSAGGTWIDLSASGLSSVDYVRFTVPTGSVLYLDGVIGLPAPEPASLGVLAAGALTLLLRRRRNRG